MIGLDCQRHISERDIKEAVGCILFTKRRLVHLLKDRISILEQIRDASYVSISEIIATEKDLFVNDNSKCTIIVCGLLNAGKSRFLNELLRGMIQLPCDSKKCTGRFVRIKYSAQPKMDIVDSEGAVIRSCFFDGKRPLASEIDLPEELRENKSELRSIVEIGIPHPMLQTGLEIIDCPGLEESDTLSRIFHNFVPQFNPDIVIYVFDQRNFFSVADCTTMNRMKGVIGARHCRVLFVANKVDVNQEAQRRNRDSDDESEENEEDESESHEEDESEKNEEDESESHEETNSEDEEEGKKSDDSNSERKKLETHHFALEEIKSSIQHHYHDVSESDIFQLSANMMYNHRDKKAVLEPFLSFQMALEKEISQAFRKLAIQKAEVCTDTITINTLKIMNVLIMAKLSFLFVKHYSTVQLEEIQICTFSDQLDSIHNDIKNILLEITKRKWRLDEYEEDVNILAGVQGSQAVSLHNITIFISDRFSNVVTHSLQLCRRDTNLSRQIQELNLQLKRLCIWVAPWSGLLKSAEKTGHFAGTTLSICCLQYFTKLEDAYVSVRNTNVPFKQTDLAVDYFKFLKEYSDLEPAITYMNQLVESEKLQLRCAIQLRSEETANRITQITADEHRYKEMWGLCGKLCHNILNIRFMCVNSPMKDTLSQLVESENKVDLTAGFTLHSTELDGKTRHVLIFSPQQKPSLVDHITSIATDLIYFEWLIPAASSGFFCVPEILFSDTKDDIYIVSGSPDNQLLSRISSMSNGTRLECLQTIFKEFKKVHKRRGTWRNFRPDGFEISRDGAGDWNSLKMNLYCPCDPTLPLLLGNHTIAPPFHVHPCLLQSYPFVTLPQTIYAFGWTVWMLAEGSGSKVPGIFSNLRTAQEVTAHVAATKPEDLISSVFSDLDQTIWGPKFDDLKQLMTFCWTVPEDATGTGILKHINGLLHKLQ